MTAIELHIFTRMILRDNGEGKATTQRMHEPEDITSALVLARQEILRELLAIRKQKPAMLSISASLKQAPATYVPVPDDFLELECGLDTMTPYSNTGAYIQAEPEYLGVATEIYPSSQIFVEAGIFAGTAGTAVYWAGFQQSLAPNGGALTESSEGFYYTMAFYAARELTTAERGHADDRWKYYDRQYQRRLGSLA